MKGKLALMIFGLLFTVACSKNNGNGSVPPTNMTGLMPLAVGNFWQYEKIDYDSAGRALDSSTDEIDIIGQVSVNGATYYQQTQKSITINAPSFFVNIDSNTLGKIDSATQYTFLKRVQMDSSSVFFWVDTVTSRCAGHNYLYGFTDSSNVDGHVCLRNVVYVDDCTGYNFENWIYYFHPGIGIVRILHFVIKSDGTFYLKTSEDLTSYHASWG